MEIEILSYVARRNFWLSQSDAHHLVSDSDRLTAQCDQIWRNVATLVEF